MDRRLSVAIVGMGFAATLHLDALRQSNNVLVAGVFDIDCDAAERLARKYDVPRVYQSWHELLMDHEVDCVAILVPPDFHESLAVDALGAGKHVVCEKPLARTVEECDRMFDQAKSNERFLFPVHNRIYSPLVSCIKDLVQANQLGDIFLAIAVGAESPTLLDQIPWLRTDVSLGGVLMAQAVHPIYLLRYLLGEVEIVTATRGSNVSDMRHEDTALMSLTHASGAVANLTATFAAGHGPSGHSLALFGTEGHVSCSMQGGADVAINVTEGIVPSVFGDSEVHILCSGGDELLSSSFFAMWEDYASAITDGTSPQVTAADGRATIAVVRAAYEAMSNGMATKLL